MVARELDDDVVAVRAAELDGSAIGVNREAMEPTTERTKTFIRTYIQWVWHERDLSPLPDMLDPGPGVQAQAHDHLRELFDALSGFEITVHDMFAEDEKVAVRATISGRHTGPLGGVPATGRDVSYGTIRIFEVRDARVVRSWGMQDRLGLLQQLGAVSDHLNINWGGTIGGDGKLGSASGEVG